MSSGSPSASRWKIGPATVADASAATALALRSKASWGYDADFMSACRDELAVTAEMLRDSRVLVEVAREDDAIVGLLVVDFTSPHAELDALFVEPGRMHRGVGRRLMARALRACAQRGHTALAIQSDPQAAAFYRRMGALDCGFSPSASIPGRMLPVLILPLACLRAEAGAHALWLRPATAADGPMLRRWDEQPHVVASDPNDDWQWETELGRDADWRSQLVAEADGRPVGYLEIIDPAREPDHYWGDTGPDLRAIDLWIGEAGDLGRGMGSAMMSLALARCFDDPAVKAVLVDPLASNERAHRFYQRHGFRALAPRRFGADECLVHRLSRSDWTGAGGAPDGR